VLVDVNGTRLWFDVDGPALVPDGSTMRERPTVVLIHGGPGTYDHSSFKPSFTRLTTHAQVIYLDLRDHGRSAWHDPTSWSFEACADDEWARVFAAFGPHVPDEQQLARRIKNAAVGRHGMDLLRRLDAISQLSSIDCPTLVCVGALDSVVPVDASCEIVDALPPGIGRLEVVPGAGHFPWLDDSADEYWSALIEFITSATIRRG
jgi:pimeloyl-ACP methyl ester carboxylesterase